MEKKSKIGCFHYVHNINFETSKRRYLNPLLSILLVVQLAPVLSAVDGLKYNNITISIAQIFGVTCVRLINNRFNLISDLREIVNAFKSYSVSKKSFNTIFPGQRLHLKDSDVCHKSMTILVDKSVSTNRYFKTLLRENSIEESVWVLFLEGSIEEYFAETYLPLPLQLFVVLLDKSDYSNIYEVFRVDSDFPLRVNLVGSWTLHYGLNLSIKTSVYSRRFDLEGRLIIAGTIDNDWPFSVKEIQNNQIVWKGFFPEVWEFLLPTINATNKYVEEKNRIVGSEEPNGKWTGMIGEVTKGNLDIIVTEVNMNSRRSKVLFFPMPIIKSKYQIFFKQPGYLLDWLAMVKPIGVGVTFILIIWIVLSALSLAICFSYSALHSLENPDLKFDFKYSLFFCIQSLSQQGTDSVPLSAACRLIFFLCYLVSSVINPSYSASLILSLTSQTPIRPYESFEELVHDGKFKITVLNSTAEYAYFTDSSDQLLMTALKTVVQIVPTTVSMDERFKSMCENHLTGTFGPFSMFLTIIDSMNLPCEVIALKQPLSSVYIGFALKKRHPFGPLINYRLLQMGETGIIHRIASSTWKSHIEVITYPEWKQVQLNQVYQAFVILAAGMALSLCILSYELWSSKRQKKIGIKL